MAAASRRVSSPEIVGRVAELAALRRAIDEIREGRPRVVLLGGEGGIGKTRLIDATESTVGEIRFLRGNCLAFGAAIPFLPFAEILRALLRQLDPADVAEVVGPARAELARFMPEIETVLGMDASRPIGSGDLERLRLYEALLRVAERIAQDGPTVFVIEDIQWIDDASLQLLSFLTHSISLGRMLLIITVRTDAVESKPAVTEFLADLERRVEVDRIELEALDLESTRNMIEAILGGGYSPATVERIWALGDGNPLFTEELLASSETTGGADITAPRLRDLVGARLGRLPRSALAVLRVAAIAGGTFDVELLATTSGREVVDVEAAIDAAAAEQLLVLARDTAGGYRFRHEIVRSTVASQLDPHEAARVHDTYADALERSRPGRGRASEIALHRDAAGDAPEALAAHVVAAAEATAAFAYAQALEHYERALSLWPRVDDAPSVARTSRARILQMSASSAARGGDFGRAIELAREVLAENSGIAPDDRELVRSSLRWYLWEAGHSGEALREARAAVARTDDVPAVWRANALAHLAGLLLAADRISEARQSANEAAELAVDADAVAEGALAHGVLGWCLLMDGEIDAGLDSIRAAIDGARRIERGARDGAPSRDGMYPMGVVLGFEQLTLALELAGHAQEAVEAAREGIIAATEQGIERTYGSKLRATEVRALYRLGRWDEAIVKVERALVAGASGPGRAALLAARALIEVGRGDFLEADATIEQAEASVTDPPADVTHSIAIARVESLAWQRRPEEGALVLAAATSDADSEDGHGRPGQAVRLDPGLPVLLMLGARIGADLATAERGGDRGGMSSKLVLERVQTGLRRAQRRSGLATSWAPELTIARAEVQRASHGNVPTAVKRWSAAVEATATVPYLGAYSHWRLADASFGDRKRRDEGARQLDAAALLIEGLGARPLGAAISDLRARAGLRSDQPAGDGLDGPDAPASKGRPFGLTARESEVLGLLAAGWGNKEIADHLFISPKTASVHVSNIYGKLGVESRVAAATLAHDLGLATTIEQEDEDDR